MGGKPRATLTCGIQIMIRRNASITTKPTPTAMTPAEAEAEIASTLPCPYGCSSSGGEAASRTLKRAMAALARSAAVSRASDKTAILPLRMPKISWIPRRPRLASNSMATIRVAALLMPGSPRSRLFHHEVTKTRSKLDNQSLDAVFDYRHVEVDEES